MFGSSRHRQKATHTVTAVTVAALLGAACSAPATTADDAGDEEAPAEETGAPTPADDEGPDLSANLAALDAVFDELEGLDDRARREQLVEMAAEEGGVVSLYGAMRLEDAQPLISAFQESTGVEVEYYRASTSAILTRVLQEIDAGHLGADIVQINGPEMLVLDGEGYLAPLERTVAYDDIVESVRHQTWVALHLAAYVMSWNTDLVSDPPTTWEGWLTDFEGTVAFELGDYDWFYALATEYFIGELEMTEQEVVELFGNAVENSRMVDGHSLSTELLGAGEYDAHGSSYSHIVDAAAEAGAPVAWEPPTEPIVVSPDGIGILATTERPASSILLLEYLLTDGQQILVGQGRTPGSTAVDGGLPPEYETIGIDLQGLQENEEKWRSLWEDVAARAG